jgi:hypothetical protein
VRDIPEDGPIKTSKHVGEGKPAVVNSDANVHAVGSS